MHIDGIVYKINGNRIVIRKKAYIYIMVTYNTIKSGLGVGDFVRCTGSWYNKKYLKNDLTVGYIKTFRAKVIKKK